VEHSGTLSKLETHDEAEIPNSNGNGIKIGYFTNEPTINQCFIFYYYNGTDGFKTSLVKEILEEGDDFTIFKTYNSVYRLDF
jgi:hypothetical protein